MFENNMEDALFFGKLSANLLGGGRSLNYLV